jgi:hypothetical protein
MAADAADGGGRRSLFVVCPDGFARVESGVTPTGKTRRASRNAGAMPQDGILSGQREARGRNGRGRMRR